MITRIEALNYRCLRRVAQDLGPFHILVGPNASGKSTFLDVPGLMRDITRDGRQDIGDVISSRSPNYEDLIWRREAGYFALALEAQIPERLVLRANGLMTGEGMTLSKIPPLCRYEIVVGGMVESGELAILREELKLGAGREPGARPHRGMPSTPSGPFRALIPEGEDWLTLLEKDVAGAARFHSEVEEPSSGRRRMHPYNLTHRRSALANLPEDEAQFPVATWFKRFLVEGVETIALDAAAMRQASPPNARRTFLPDGSSLPWVLSEFLSKNPNGLVDQWFEHVRIALPHFHSVRVVSDPEGKARYIKLLYSDGLEVPSWLVSDGTLRFLALTLLAYLPEFTGTYLIEEPENGIHPTAVELVYESLRSVYDGQVLVATHSPAVLSLAELNQVLCFDKTDEEGVRIIPGHQHPRLRHWKGEVSLGTLFAGGVLG